LKLDIFHYPSFIGRGVKLTTHLHLVSRSKNAWSYNFHSPNTPSWRGAQLKKNAQEQLHMYLYCCGRIPTSYSVGTGDSFPGDEVAGAWSWPLTSM